METKKNLSLPIYENWQAFKCNIPSRGHYEYEMLSDAIITGENTTDFGPYQFINPVCRTQGVRAVLILRLDYRLREYGERPFDMKETDVGCYHGGDLPDEIAALASLSMGVRIKAGKLTREFAPSNDKFGRPVGWQDSFIPDIKLEYGRYKLPSVVRECSVVSLEPLKYLADLSEIDTVLLVKAARLYQQALWVAESDPSLSWIMFVSALETAAEQWRRNQSSNEERLRGSKEELYNYLVSLSTPGLTEKVANFLSDSLGATREFVDFVITFLPEPPEKRPPEYLQILWESKQFEKSLKIIYDYRSKALHGGTPFPYPMCESPYYQKDFQALAEKPTGLACQANSGVWLIDDTPLLLNTFEYITRGCLLKWWEQLRK
ncbi:MAG: hypothetical protein KKC39_06810 [Candidatus Omnitrophica bacterium]|nr:hypothetical protein [Candidatus Omnitrophota bacterium]MBU4303570.1 hypothetical protein [Candidatus Omnitrophota bacterium]MBU4468429.1 hypothetical protein [Candidatus Omnitrophota bacterium]MCG2708422.1 hypothetical protein [Candidatus Omnitrophota bacterium]